jgi:hypothetical protein
MTSDGWGEMFDGDTCTAKMYAHVVGVLNRLSSVHKHGSEDPISMSKNCLNLS